MERVQRRVAIRISRGYRTISSDAAMVLAGCLPLRLSLTGRGVSEWQEQWDASSKGSWTRRLIPSVKDWIERPHGQLSFHLTQLLSAHGNCGEYLERFGIITDADCPACPGAIQSMEHMAFECPLYNEARRSWTNIMGTDTTPDNLVDRMGLSLERWEATDAFAKAILHSPE